MSARLPPRQQTTVEREVKKVIVYQMRRLGFQCFITGDRRPGCQGCYPDGWPDIYFRHRGKQLHGWVEIKRYGETLRPEQEKFRDEGLACGEIYVTVDSLSVLWAWLREVGIMAPIGGPDAAARISRAPSAGTRDAGDRPLG